MPDPSTSVDTIAKRFTPSMNAATSRLGVLCDFSIVFVAVAALGLITAGVYQLYPSLPSWAAAIPPAFPIVLSLLVHAVLHNARKAVVQWLSRIPFPVENLNALLSGAGEHFEVHFQGDMPSREVFMNHLEHASEEAYVLDQDEQERTISARFGVIESKYNPHAEAFRRYQRMRAIVERSLIPLHEKHPVERVLIV